MSPDVQLEVIYEDDETDEGAVSVSLDGHPDHGHEEEEEVLLLRAENRQLREHLSILAREVERADAEMVRWRRKCRIVEDERDGLSREVDRLASKRPKSMLVYSSAAQQAPSPPSTDPTPSSVGSMSPPSPRIPTHRGRLHTANPVLYSTPNPTPTEPRDSWSYFDLHKDTESVWGAGVWGSSEPATVWGTGAGDEVNVWGPRTDGISPTWASEDSFAPKQNAWASKLNDTAALSPLRSAYPHPNGHGQGEREREWEKEREKETERDTSIHRRSLPIQPPHLSIDAAPSLGSLSRSGSASDSSVSHSGSGSTSHSGSGSALSRSTSYSSHSHSHSHSSHPRLEAPSTHLRSHSVGVIGSGSGSNVATGPVCSSLVSSPSHGVPSVENDTSPGPSRGDVDQAAKMSTNTYVSRPARLGASRSDPSPHGYGNGHLHLTRTLSTTSSSSSLTHSQSIGPSSAGHYESEPSFEAEFRAGLRDGGSVALDARLPRDKRVGDVGAVEVGGLELNKGLSRAASSTSLHSHSAHSHSPSPEPDAKSGDGGNAVVTKGAGGSNDRGLNRVGGGDTTLSKRDINGHAYHPNSHVNAALSETSMPLSPQVSSQPLSPTTKAFALRANAPAFVAFTAAVSSPSGFARGGISGNGGGLDVSAVNGSGNRAADGAPFSPNMNARPFSPTIKIGTVGTPFSPNPHVSPLLPAPGASTFSPTSSTFPEAIPSFSSGTSSYFPPSHPTTPVLHNDPEYGPVIVHGPLPPRHHAQHLSPSRGLYGAYSNANASSPVHSVANFTTHAASSPQVQILSPALPSPQPRRKRELANVPPRHLGLGLGGKRNVSVAGTAVGGYEYVGWKK